MEHRRRRLELARASCFWCGGLHGARHALSVCSPCATRFSIMRSLEMSGSYPLDDQSIDAALTRKSPGNYALGYMDDGAFLVFFVGRSDSDVRQRLHEWVGMPSAHDDYASAAKAPWGSQRPGWPDSPALGRVGNVDTRYTQFAYSYAPTADEAYAKEWRNYDAFGGRHGLDNRAQPDSATG